MVLMSPQIRRTTPCSYVVGANDSVDIEAEIENTTVLNDINADLLISNMNATVVLDKDMEERKGPQKMITQDFLADKVIKENRITIVSSMSCFVVEGFTSKKYLVNLTPESCSCPSLKTCYHLKSVKKAFNITTGNNAKTASKNISQLRKNSRHRQGKTTGQKTPKFTDFETIPKTPSLKGTISSSATDKPMAKSAPKSTLKTPNLILKQHALKGNCQ